MVKIELRNMVLKPVKRANGKFIIGEFDRFGYTGQSGAFDGKEFENITEIENAIGHINRMRR